MLGRWFWIGAVALAVAVLPATGHGSSRAASSAQWQLLLSSPLVRLPRAIAVDRRGGALGNKWAYTTDSAAQRVVKFGTGGRVLGSWQYGVSARPGNAASIAVGGSGNVFVANSADNYVSKFSPSGLLLARWGRFGGLRDIALDRGGNIYLAENQPHRITEISPSGQLIQHWDTYSLWNGNSAGNPTHLAMGPGGSVYASTRCYGLACSKRVIYMSGGGYYVQTLLPLQANGLTGDQRGFVGLGATMAGTPR